MVREQIIRVKGLSYKPSEEDEDILKDINLELWKGDFCLLLGPSGCGKSLLSRCLVGLIPHIDEGVMTGMVEVEGKDTRNHPVHDLATTIGIIFQNPDDQILSLRVVDEVAIGVEMHGLSHEEIKQRVEDFIRLLGISQLKDKLTFAISGGQKQKVSIASNLAILQDVLILDDPTTDLDPVCTSDVVQTLGRLHAEMGKTLIVIEHDLDNLIELANHVIVMDDGQVVYDGSPAEVLWQHYEDVMRLGVNLPQHLEIAHLLSQCGYQIQESAVFKEEVFKVFCKFVEDHHLPPPRSKRVKSQKAKPVLSVRDLGFSYVPGIPVLRGLSFDIHQGEFVALIGANGSGKTTLVNNLIGLLQPNQGRVMIEGHDTRKTKTSDLVVNIGYVFQNPDHQLFANTVEEEVAFSFRAKDVLDEEADLRMSKVLDTVGLTLMRDRHPFSLSRGQRQKLAVATALVHDPNILILDEPATGQDRRTLSNLLDLMSWLTQEGRTIIMVTHNMDIVAAYATRIMVMADGQIALDGGPREVFYDEFEVLNSLNLKPTTLIDLCRRMEDMGCPRFMTLDQLEESLKDAKKGGSNNKKC